METESGHSGELAAILERLDKMEGGLIEKFDGLLKPISQRLDDLASSLQKTTQKAEEAYAISSEHTNKIAKLQELSDKTFEQIVVLNNKSRFFNLKLRGLAESVESSDDLVSDITAWLVNTLKLEDVFFPYTISILQDR